MNETIRNRRKGKEEQPPQELPDPKPDLKEEVKENPFDNWRDFMNNNLGAYTKKYGGHKAAMAQLSEEWKALKGSK